MNTFVGFLRLANYVNACCVIFGVILSIYLRGINWDKQEENNKEKRDYGANLSKKGFIISSQGPFVRNK